MTYCTLQCFLVDNTIHLCFVHSSMYHAICCLLLSVSTAVLFSLLVDLQVKLEFLVALLAILVPTFCDYFVVVLLHTSLQP